MILNLFFLVVLNVTLESIGDMYYQANSCSMAIYYYEQALAHEYSDSVLVKLGRSCLVNGDYDRAIAIFNHKKNKDSQIHFYMGQANFYQENFTDAEKHFAMALDLSKTEPAQYQYYYGLSLVLQNKYQTAESIFIKMSPFPDLEYWLGFLRAERGDYLASQRYLTEAINKDGWWWPHAAYILAYIKKEIDPLFDFHADERLRLLKAGLFFKNKKYDQALDLYSTIKNYQPYRRIGEAMIYEMKDSLELALSIFDDVIAATEKKELKKISYLHGGRISLNLSKISLAKSYFLNYLKLTDEKNEPVCFQLGKIYFDEAQYMSALTYLNQLSDTVDDYLFYKGRAYYRLNQHETAIKLLNRHHQLFPGSSYGDRTLIILGNLYWKKRDYKRARYFWLKLTELHPDSRYLAFAQMRVGDSFVRENEHANALKAYRKVLDFKPSATLMDDARLAIEEMKYRLNIYPTYHDALKAFLRKYAQSDKASAVQLKLANLFIESNELHQAIQLLEKIIKQYVDLADEALLMLAEVYKRLGNTGQEKNSYHQLITQFANTPNAYLGSLELAKIYAAEKNFDSSLYYYNLLLDNKDYQSKALLEIGRLYRTLKKYNEAILVLKRLSNETEGREFFDEVNIELSKVHKEQGNLDEAIKTLKILEERKINNAEVSILKGDIYNLKQDYSAARDAYLRAAELYSGQRNKAAHALTLAATMSQAANNIADARNFYNQALFLASDERLKIEIKTKLEKLNE